MKNKIIAFLLGIIFGIALWLIFEIEKKENIEKEIQQIEKNIKKINLRTNNEIIEDKKNQLLKDFVKKNTVPVVAKEKKSEIIEIEMISYQKLYNNIYDILTTDERIKNLYGYQDFENTVLNKRLNKLKENIIHTNILNKKTKTIEKYDYIPIDIKCPNDAFCKKIIIDDINEIYQSNKDILTYNDFNKNDIQMNEIVSLLQSNKTFYEYYKTEE